MKTRRSVLRTQAGSEETCLQFTTPDSKYG